MKMIVSIMPLLLILSSAYPQTGWKICTSPSFQNRVDDIFMLDTQTGYAVCGDGKIVKTTDGDTWTTLTQTANTYYRSVEFINTKKGFVGGFPQGSNTTTNINILRKTIDGGITWTDLSPLLHPRARKGICGLAIPDSNTIYGCGNWYQDSGYIIKSVDGGNTWSFIDMQPYASSIIDMYFINKDTGFATGRGPLPLRTGIILYTTNGGQSWTYKFQNTTASQYCWKIQRLTDKLYFASLEDMLNVKPSILRSTDGGMNWTIQQVANNKYNIEGIGFIDALNGWTGGDANFSFKSTNGGVTWDTVQICPFMNRVFKVNDTTLFATGDRIWKYKGDAIIPVLPSARYALVRCSPNPVHDNLKIDISLLRNTHVLLIVLDNSGKQINVIDNSDKQQGDYQYHFNPKYLPAGIYYIVIKTHEDKQVSKIVVSH
jgi:photosystem II stability/assembly factor-like uncharacterized protein